MADWEVGQEVWIVPTDNRSKPRSGVVGKIARKWVTIDKYTRFEKETGLLDGNGFSSPARAWPSRDAYEAHREIREKWDGLIRGIIRNMYRPPTHLTMDDLCEIEGLLFPALSETEG